MSSDQESKKPKGFNNQQIAALQEYIVSACEDETKLVMEHTDKRFNELSISLSSSLNDKIDGKFKEIQALLQSLQQVKEIKDDMKKLDDDVKASFQTPIKTSVPVNISFTSNTDSIISLPNSTMIDNTSSPNPTININNHGIPNITHPLLSNSTGAVNIQSGPTSNTVSKTEEQPSAAIDHHQKLPSHTIKLPGYNVTPDEYAMWSRKILTSIKGLTKYDGMIDKPPDESWELFKGNNSKYPPAVLERHYVNALKLVWAYLFRSVDDDIACQIQEEMEASPHLYNVPKKLGFATIANDFYEDVNGFWEKLKTRYILKSAFRLDEVLEKLRSLQYDGKEDPKGFISEYHQIHAQGKLLVPEFPVYTDSVKAMDILSRLPKSTVFGTIKSHFYHRVTGIQTITLQEVEDALRHWWIDQGSVKHYRKEGGTISKPESHKENRRSTRGRDSKPLTANPVYKSSSQGNGKDKRTHAREGYRSSSASRSRSRSKSKDPSNYGNSEHSEESEDSVFQFACFTHDDERSFVANSTTGNGRYIPNSDEAIMDGGSDAMLTPRRDLLDKVKDIPSVRIGTIAGEKSSKQEGSLKLNSRAIALHVKYVPHIPFTILSVGQICSADQCIVVHTKKAAYTVPKGIISERILMQQSILTCPKKGGLYVHQLPGSNNDTVITQFKVTPNESRKIPLKTNNDIGDAKESTSSSREARQELMEARARRDVTRDTNNSNNIPSNNNITANPVSTRSTIRKSSPHPSKVNFKETTNVEITPTEHDDHIESESESSSDQDL